MWSGGCYRSGPAGGRWIRLDRSASAGFGKCGHMLESRKRSKFEDKIIFTEVERKAMGG